LVASTGKIDDEVIDVSGGDQLNKSQFEVVVTIINVPQSSIVQPIRRLINECAVNPHGFVDRESKL
jgi:hypothetical protein